MVYNRTTIINVGIPGLRKYKASLIAQLVKNPPAMQEIPVQFLGWEDSPGEGKGYSLQYSGLENSMDCRVHGVAESDTTEQLLFTELKQIWASLVAQLVKNPPEMWETWVRSLGWEATLEKGKATHSSIFTWRISWTVYSSRSYKESDTTERL